MITSFCDVLRTRAKEAVELRRDRLEKGTEDDARVRGEIWGIRAFMEVVDDLEETARRRDNEAL
jgi:hypothetical protein